MRIRGLAAAAGAVAVALLLAGCTSSDGLAGKYGSGQGYVSGDGQYLELRPDERKEAVEFSGTTVEGEAFDSADLLGRLVVVNFWYAGCPPCRIEAPGLAALAAELEDVAFVGVNTYDTAPVAAAFETAHGVEYPSILDVQSGAAQLAFAGYVPPNAVPTTLVLDTEGRVAARISGRVEDPENLRAMIERVEEEG